MQLVDHLFILLLFVAQPIHGALAFHRYLAKIEAGEPANRIKLYWQTLVVEWVALAVLASAWLYYARSFADLGFEAPGGAGFWIGGVALIALTVVLVRSWLAAKTLSQADKDKARESFGKLVHFMPHDDREYRPFFGLSITAGIVEEVIYRGFALWYLAQFMPLWAGVLVSSVFFGLGHSYQGLSGSIRTGLVGLAAALLYVVSGSIWLPIVGHALLDILQGKMLVEILGNGRPADGSPVPDQQRDREPSGSDAHC